MTRTETEWFDHYARAIQTLDPILVESIKLELASLISRLGAYLLGGMTSEEEVVFESRSMKFQTRVNDLLESRGFKTTQDIDLVTFSFFQRLGGSGKTEWP